MCKENKNIKTFYKNYFYLFTWSMLDSVVDYLKSVAYENGGVGSNMKSQVQKTK